MASGHYSNKKVAIVLSGCGVYDGSEITETISILTELSRNSVYYQAFAPAQTQYHTINHIKGEPVPTDSRSVLEESSRITRGNIKDMQDLKAEHFDALILPGGFGAAKNLSNFGYSNHFEVNDQVQQVLKDFKNSSKVIAACCISPILLAKTFEGQGIRLTLGLSVGDKWLYKGAIETAKQLGCEIVECQVGEVCVDEKNKIITSPAYMYDGKTHEIFDGVQKMVKKTLEFTLQ